MNKHNYESAVPDCLLERYIALEDMSFRFTWNLSGLPGDRVLIGYFCEGEEEFLRITLESGTLNIRSEEEMLVSEKEAAAIHQYLIMSGWMVMPAPFGTGISPYVKKTK